MNNFTIDDKIACLKREVILRKATYKKALLSGKMKADEAQKEGLLMRGILLDYQLYDLFAKNKSGHLAVVYTTEKIACLKREIAMRKQVYPQQIEDAHISQAKADREISIMESILADYQAAAQSDLSEFPLFN